MKRAARMLDERVFCWNQQAVPRVVDDDEAHLQNLKVFNGASLTAGKVWWATRSQQASPVKWLERDERVARENLSTVPARSSSISL